MTIEELRSKYCGSYYTNTYELDFEEIYVENKHIYRIDDVKSVESGEVIFTCMVIAICSETEKKTGEKRVRIMAFDDKIVTPSGEFEKYNFYRFKKSDKNEWYKIIMEFIEVLHKKTSTPIYMEHYCEKCSNKWTESCKVCCRRGTDVPSQYMEKK